MSLTPILDLEQDPPEPTRDWLALGISILAGLSIGLMLRVPRLPPFNLLLWLVGLYIAIGVHEAGHAIAAKLCGMETGGFAVGGLLLFKSGKHWVLRFDRRYLFGGFVKPLPAKGNFHPARFAWMVAGGPLASLVLAIVCGFFSLRIHGSAARWPGSLFWAALITLISLFPMSSGVNKSDGGRLWLLLRHPEQSRSWIALLALQTEEAKGVLPRDWDSELVEQALKPDPSWGEFPYRQLLTFYRKLDCGEEQGAAQHIEDALAYSSRCGKMVRYCLFLEAACVNAKLSKNAGNARIWMDRACELRKPESVEATLAAIEMCEGRYSDALRHLTEARNFLDRKKLDSGLARFVRERIAQSEAECRTALRG